MNKKKYLILIYFILLSMNTKKNGKTLKYTILSQIDKQPYFNKIINKPKQKE